MTLRPITALACSVCLLLPAVGEVPAGLLPAESPTTAPATRPASLFDPARHMRVADVRPGMKGFVSTVIAGTQPERFEIEVLSVLRNVNGPGRDMILIGVRGPLMDFTGSIAGMSGSPVYVVDQAGNSRLIGAYAFGWDWAKLAVVGVQPIEYMTELSPPAPLPTALDGANAPRARADLLRLGLRSWIERRMPTPNAAPIGTEHGLRALRMPLAVAGLDDTSQRVLHRHLESLGFAPRTATVAGGGDPQLDAPLQPGGVLVIPLASGDIDISAYGTVTDVIGDRILAFGHPNNGDGRTSLPFTSGRVDATIASYRDSFKIATGGPVLGAIDLDSGVGVAGTVGNTPATFPMRVRVTQIDGSNRDFNYTLTEHPATLPLLSGLIAQQSAVTGQDLPRDYTIDYVATGRFDGGGSFTSAGMVTNDAEAPLLVPIGLPMAVVLNNDFARPAVDRLDVEVRILPGHRTARIESARLLRPTHQAGDRVKILVTLRPMLGERVVVTLHLQLPRDLPPGAYGIAIEDQQVFLSSDAMLNPQRYIADDLDQLYLLMNAVLGNRPDAIYARLVLPQPTGVAVGRTPLNDLPGSRRMVLAQSLPTVAPLTDAPTVRLQQPYIVSGQLMLNIEVEK